MESNEKTAAKISPTKRILEPENQIRTARPGSRRRTYIHEFTWMPNSNQEKIFDNNPWRPGKMDVFDFGKPFKELLADMVLAYTRMHVARIYKKWHWPEDLLRDYFSDLLATAYNAAFRGIGSWKPKYNLANFVQSHVMFSILRLAEQHKKDLLYVPSEKLSNLSCSFMEAMEMVQDHIDNNDERGAASLMSSILDEVNFDDELED